MLRRTSLLVALSLSMLATACDDPAEGKPKAKVEDAAKDDAKKPEEAAKADDGAKATEFTLNTEASKLAFVGSKVTGSHPGGFNKFTTKASFPEGKAAGGNVSVEIDVDSMFSDSDDLTKHLKSPDFFDAAKFPKATFASTAIKEGGSDGHSHTVEGNLELHGVKKKITFPATIEVDGDKASVKSEFSINRKDFDMKYEGKADDLIRDDVVIKLDVQLAK